MADVIEPPTASVTNGGIFESSPEAVVVPAVEPVVVSDDETAEDATDVEPVADPVVVSDDETEEDVPVVESDDEAEEDATVVESDDETEEWIATDPNIEMITESLEGKKWISYVDYDFKVIRKEPITTSIVDDHGNEMDTTTNYYAEGIRNNDDFT